MTYPLLPEPNKQIKSACVCVWRPEGNRILAVDHKTLGLAMPGGKCYPLETFESCGIRETQEETGLAVMMLRPLFDHTADGYWCRIYWTCAAKGTLASLEKTNPRWVEPADLLTPRSYYREVYIEIFDRIGVRWR